MFDLEQKIFAMVRSIVINHNIRAYFYWNELISCKSKHRDENDLFGVRNALICYTTARINPYPGSKKTGKNADNKGESHQ